MFVHVVYGSESGDRIVKFDSTATMSGVLQSVSHGSRGCTLYMYNKHNICTSHSELVENCRVYVVKRKPL